MNADPTHDLSIEARLKTLEERLARLEQRLEPTPAFVPVRPEAAPLLNTAEPGSPAVAAEILPAAAAPVSQTVLPMATAQPPPMPRRALPLRATSELAPASAATPASPSPRLPAGGSLETVVGLKWAGWAGAIIVVIGAALGIKYAYDHDWLGNLPPAVRLAMLSLGAFGLIGAGEVVFRRIGAVAAAGLFGAGVATLFVISYAGFGYYDLYGPDAAFFLMGAVTLIGAAVAMRGNLVSIAVLSIIGGNVAPLTLHSDSPRLLPLMAYLLMMQVVAVLLACWGRSAKWWVLRGLALVTICLWMSYPVASPEYFPGSSRSQILLFVIVFAGLFHFELVVSSLRGPRNLTAHQPGFAVPMPLGVRDGRAEQSGIGVTFSLFVTAAFTVALLCLLDDRSDLIRGACVLSLAAFCLALGAALPRLVRGRDPMAPPSLVLALSVGYRLQAVGLLVVAVPVVLSDVWITIAWTALAILFAVVGAAMNRGVARLAAVGVWLLAVLHLLVWTLGASFGTSTSGPFATWATLLAVTIPAYLILAALIAAVGHTVAALIREDGSPESAARNALQPARETVDTVAVDPAHDAAPGEPSDAAKGLHNLQYASHEKAARPRAGRAFIVLAVMTDIGAALLFLLAAAAALPAFGFTLAMIGYAWCLLGAGQIVRAGMMHPLGLVIVLGAAAKWMLYDTLNDYLATGPDGSAYVPVYNPAVAAGLAVFVSGLALFRLPIRLPGSESRGERSRRVPSLNSSIHAIAGLVAVLVMLWLVTMEIDRYFTFRAGAVRTAMTAAASRDRQVAISIFWSFYGAACVVIGFVIRKAGLRYFGLTLLGVTVVKVLLIDLSTVETGYRIVSFLGLGLLLLGTSVLYGKLSPMLLGQPSKTEPHDV